MKSTMTVEEARTMLGTEFDYFFSNGNYIRAYVKAFDPKIGLTCYSLGLETSNGYKFQLEDMSDDGACMIGINLKRAPKDLQKCLDVLTIIRDTGKYTVGQLSSKPSFGIVTCAFSK